MCLPTKEELHLLNVTNDRIKLPTPTSTYIIWNGCSANSDCFINRSLVISWTGWISVLKLYAHSLKFTAVESYSHSYTP
jgi:hypothetical protein